jgi:hypothetical protein
MSDTSNPAPAAAGSSDTSAPLTPADIFKQLEAYGGTDEDEHPSEPSAVGDDKAEAEPAPIEAEDEPEGPVDAEAETQDGDEDEGPSDDADEPEQKETSEEDREADDRKFRLRDRTEVTLGDLKKGFDRAREFERALPQIQQTLQSVEQTKQRLAAEQQQFQAYASQIAQIAMENLPPEPDPALMDQASGKYDPIQFLEQKHVRDIALARFNERFSKAAQDRQAQEERAAQEQQAAMRQSTQNAIQQFARMRPELNTPEAAKAFGEGVNRVAQHLRYTPQEMGQIHDPRLYEALRLADIGLRAEQGQLQQKAVKTQQQAIAAKKVVAAPPVTTPAARQAIGARETAALRDKVGRAKKTGSKADILDALASID